VLLVLALCLACCVGPSHGQTPLYEQRPFDRITLDEANEGLVIDVLPITEFPNRQLPAELPKSGKLVFERIDEPGETYECYWRSIAKIELFEQMILSEVGGLVRDGKFDDAFEYFVHLKNEKPDLPGLDRAYQTYLFEETKAMARAGQWELGLARLREIHALNAQFPDLDRALGSVSQRLIDEYVAKEEYWIARIYLEQLAEWYPDHPVVAAKRDELKEAAGVHLAAARKAADEGRLGEAHASLRALTTIWPTLPGANEIRQTITDRYPRFVVGVTSPATATEPGRLHDWASRRTGRLVERTLLEFIGPGTEGGQYLCPFGEMKSEDLGRRLEFHLYEDVTIGDGQSLTGYDLARQFLAMADPATLHYQQLWSDLFESVSVDRVFTATAQLRRPFVLPQAMLQITLDTGQPATGESSAARRIGPYYLKSNEDAEAVFLSNTSYFGDGANRPKEMVEQHFEKGAHAILALRRGQIDVIDRINPWELDKVREIPHVEVQRYAVPLVHCLIPNPNGPLSSHRSYRRALTYGIDREAILGLLTRGEDLPGCRTISGPFSPGVTLDDPLDYAYEETIEPRSYEPHLAVILAEIAVTDWINAERKKREKATEKSGEQNGGADPPAADADESPTAEKEGPEEGDAAEADAAEDVVEDPGPTIDVPTPVLAYPPTELARMAVGQIKRQLKVVGVELELKELGPEVPAQIPEDVDFLYAELAMWEPIVDADRLLGDDGLMGEASPYMRQALLRLRQSVDWPNVGRQLRSIHHLAHSEVTIIPLWQICDHFAYVRSLQGVGESPVTLYQNIENWQMTPPAAK